MHISLIIWSQNPDSQSTKVANYCRNHLETSWISASLIDLWESHLPYHTDENNSESESWKLIWEPYHKTLSRSDGIIIVSPERWWMVPWVLKNFFLRCDDNELAHKPWLLIGVSSGTWWAYPIAELRMSSYKNTKICYLPDHVIVRNVTKVLNGEQTEESQKIGKRINTSLEKLVAYMKWFTIIREQQIIKDNPMPYGM